MENKVSIDRIPFKTVYLGILFNLDPILIIRDTRAARSGVQCFHIQTITFIYFFRLKYFF